MASWEFPRTEPIDLRVNIASGTVTITAEPTEVVTVNLKAAGSGRRADELIADMRVEYADGRLDIAEPQNFGLRLRHMNLDLAVTVPVGSRCTVHTASADINCTGELGSLDAGTASGRISAQTVQGPCEVNSASGDIHLDETAAEFTASTASGRIQLRHARGEVKARNVSGTVKIGTADASASARTASGNVRLGSVARGQADLQTVSGDISVGVAEGTGVFLDLTSLSGRVTSELVPDVHGPDGAQLQLRCRSLSSSVKVTRAALADAPS